MSEKNLISIAIPTLNRAKLLEGAIKSIINQTYTNWELLILDNNSEDETEQVVQKFNNEKIRYYKSDKTITMTENWERAFKFAKGKYFIKIDDDCTLFKNFLERSLNIFSKEKPIVIFFNYYVQMLQNVFYSILENKNEIIELDFKKVIFLEYLMLSSSNFCIFNLQEIKTLFKDKKIYFTPMPDRWMIMNLINMSFSTKSIKLSFSYEIGGINRHLIKPSYVSEKFINYNNVKNNDVFYNKNPFANGRIYVSRIFNEILKNSEEETFKKYFLENVTSFYHLTTFEFLGHYYEIGKKKFSFTKIQSLTLYFFYIFFRLFRKPFDKISYQNSMIYLIKLTRNFLVNIFNLKKFEKNFYKDIENSKIVGSLKLVNTLNEIDKNHSRVIVDKQLKSLSRIVNL